MGLLWSASEEGPRRLGKRRDPVECGSCGHLDLLDRDAELSCLVDEVLGDAAAGEGDDALGEEVEEVVVAAEGSGAAVAVPVGLADDLVDAALLGPACGDALDARAAAVDQHHVGVRFSIPSAEELQELLT